jgi:hypothetical protein
MGILCTIFDHLHPWAIKYGVYCTYFLSTHKLAALCEDYPYLPRNMEIVCRILFLHLCATLTASIFTKHMLAWQFFKKNSYTELYENPVNILVTVTRSLMESGTYKFMEGFFPQKYIPYNNFSDSNILLYSFIFYYLNCEFLANTWFLAYEMIWTHYNCISFLVLFTLKWHMSDWTYCWLLCNKIAFINKVHLLVLLNNIIYYWGKGLLWSLCAFLYVTIIM